MAKVLGKDYRHVYAIVRFDYDFHELSHQITVKAIVWSEEKAASEVDRLNKLNADKNCTYFWQVTRLDNE